MSETITFFGQDDGTYTYDNGPVPVGTESNDLVVGGKFNSTVEGGEGDDILIGGSIELQTRGEHAGKYKITDSGSVDTFVFNFTLASSVGQTFYFRPNEDGSAGDMPSLSANPQAWANYLEQLAAWRESMEAAYQAADTDTDTTTLYSTAKKSLGQEYTFDNSFTVGGELAITASDGHDVIIDFGSEDALHLKGLKDIGQADFQTLFDVSSSEDETVLSWTGGSIIIKGLSGFADDAAFWSHATQAGWFLP